MRQVRTFVRVYVHITDVCRFVRNVSATRIATHHAVCVRLSDLFAVHIFALYHSFYASFCLSDFLDTLI